MKNLMILALSLLVVACGGPEGEKVEAEEAVETPAAPVENTSVAVNTEASVINWIGAKLSGDQHTGTLSLSDGELMTADGQLVGGKFTVDMSSMKVTDDTPEQGKEKLVGHLSTGDFFEVEKYPTATFEITGVEAAEANEAGVTHNITGNLTMKDITKSITIPAMVSMSEGGVSAKTTQFTIDRTEWNVMYGTSAAGALKDNLINEDVALQINLSTK